jgi:hypothetical protein
MDSITHYGFQQEQPEEVKKAINENPKRDSEQK